jgi:hypothetical protein
MLLDEFCCPDDCLEIPDDFIDFYFYDNSRKVLFGGGDYSIEFLWSWQ